MKLFDVVLFLHIAALLGAIANAGIIHHAEWSSRRATTVSELRVWAGVVRRFGPLFPIFIALLLVLGAWLVHLSKREFHFDDGWIITAVGALVVLGGVGGAVLDPAAKRVVAQLAAAPDGPVTPELRTLVSNPVTWTLSHMSTGLALGVAFSMTTKPALGGALVCLVVGAGLGASIGNFGARSAKAVPATT